MGRYKTMRQEDIDWMFANYGQRTVDECARELGVSVRDDGYHFGVETKEEIPTEKYVKFCKCLQTALDVLNGKED